MKAIVTKYFGPGDVRGACVRAYAEGVPTVRTSYAHDGKEHDRACAALLAKMKWGGDWVSGGMPDNRGNCYVCMPGKSKRDEATVNGHPLSELLK